MTNQTPQAKTAIYTASEPVYVNDPLALQLTSAIEDNVVISAVLKLFTFSFSTSQQELVDWQPVKHY